MKIIDNTLYLEDIPVEKIMQEYGSPLYVYEESVLRSQYRQLSGGFPEGLTEIHYSVVHPTHFIKLFHSRINNGNSRFTMLPNHQIFFIF